LTFLEAILLGLVQGLTEFLPISSSGHLVLAQSILGIENDGIAFEIIVHFGTLLAVIIAFKEDLLKILNGIRDSLFLKKKNLNDENSSSTSGSRLLIFLIIGTIPTAILGYIFQGFFESTFANPVFVYFALIFTGIVLTISRIGKNNSTPLSYSKSFLIGLAQVVAFFPGVSRSGTTISAGLLMGINPVESARYSFLLAVPLILGVTLVKSFELATESLSLHLVISYLIACFTAFISGLWAIKWLLKIVQNKKFDRFAYYCFAIGFIGLTINFLK